MKICPDCRRELPCEAFSKNNKSKDRLAYACKTCMVVRSTARAKANPWGAWAGWTLSGHRRDGYEVVLTCKELTSIAKNATHCAYCHEELVWGGIDGKCHNHSPSLDRVNNESVLTKDNTTIVCMLCNSTKGNRTLAEYKDFISKMYHILNGE